MKRIFLFLLVILLLTGCGTDQPEITDPMDTTGVPETTVPEASGFYDPSNELEAQTGGAVRVYPLGINNCSGVELMGEDLLMFTTGEENTFLTLLTGENLTEAVVVNLGSYIFPAEPDVRVSEQGVGYYDSDANAVVFLNVELQETRRITVPEAVQGTPVLTKDWSTIYYCTDNAIRGLELESGIPRLVRGEYECQWQTLNQLYWDDTVLKCTAAVSDEEVYSFYISAETGELLYSGDQLTVLAAGGEWFYACVQEGSAVEHLYGSEETEIRVLLPLVADAQVYPVLELGGVLTAAYDETGCTLDYYDLATGKRTASLQLNCVDGITDYLTDFKNNRIWFLGYDMETDSQTLYCWEPEKSSISDRTDYTDQYYTEDNPDIEGLAECQTRAEQLSEKYGVEISIWEEAVELEPDDYDYQAEYKVQAYTHGLDALEQALASYPEGFLKQAAARTDSGVIHISLLRDITGDVQQGTLAEVGGIQYWSGSGDAYIGLVLNDTLAQDLYHEVFHVIDSYVLSSCVRYDDWEELNPYGFEYDYDYIQNQTREDYEYLDGEQQAFIDMYSMSFPGEDRARIMEYAMMPDCEDYFGSELMQEKLTRLCEGIREAFEMEDKPEVLPWEVYLEEPLAPQSDE